MKTLIIVLIAKTDCATNLILPAFGDFKCVKYLWKIVRCTSDAAFRVDQETLQRPFGYLATKINPYILFSSFWYLASWDPLSESTQFNYNTEYFVCLTNMLICGFRSDSCAHECNEKERRNELIPNSKEDYIRLLSRSLYNSWHNLKSLGQLNFKADSKLIASLL